MKNPDRIYSLPSVVSLEPSAPQERRDTEGAGAASRGVILLACLLAVGVFLGHYTLERAFDRLQVFEQYDILFDTDPNVRIVGFGNGWGDFNRNLLHPNLANFVNPPIRFLAAGLQTAGLADGEIGEIRRALALLVNPFASVLMALSLLLLFLRLNYSIGQASLLALVGAVSFSQAIFGSLPDHFALSGVVLTLSFLLAADLLQSRGEVRWPAWILIGAVAGGITLTNILIVLLLFWIPLLCCRRRLAGPTRQAALLGVLIAATVFASHHLLNLGYDDDPHPTTDAVVWSGHFWRPEVVENLKRFPTAVADSIAPTEPQPVRIRYLQPRGSRYNFEFTLERGGEVFSRRNLLGTAVLLLVAAGTVVHLRAGGIRRPLALAALAVLAYNGLFHALWGKEYFLYSQHWLTAAIFLLAGILGGRPPLRTAALGALAVLTVFVALNNLLNLQLILANLEAFTLAMQSAVPG